MCLGDCFQAEEQVRKHCHCLNVYCQQVTIDHLIHIFRFEKLAIEPEAPQVRPNPKKFQVKRFKVNILTLAFLAKHLSK